MTPQDFKRAERLIGVEGGELAALLGFHRVSYGKYTRGERKAPRGVYYAIAWMMLYGPALPWELAKLPEVLRDTRKRLRLHQGELGDLLGVPRDSVSLLELAKPDVTPRRYVLYALAWLLLYGSRLPFLDH